MGYTLVTRGRPGREPLETGCLRELRLPEAPFESRPLRRTRRTDTRRRRCR